MVVDIGGIIVTSSDGSGRTRGAVIVTVILGGLAGLVGAVTVTAKSSTRGGPFPGRVW